MINNITVTWASTKELKLYGVYSYMIIFIHYSLSILLLKFTMVTFFIFHSKSSFTVIHRIILVFIKGAHGLKSTRQ